MKFKVDENLPIEVAELFNQAGYEAETVHDENLVGEVDQKLAETCQLERRAIITLDMDFADIRAYPPKQYPGIIVLRLKRQDKQNVLEVVTRITKAFKTEELEGCLWIVDERQIRVRD